MIPGSIGSRRFRQPLQLVYRGHGEVFQDGASAVETRLGYSTVLGGVGPVVNDLVLWNVFVGAEYDTDTLRQDLTGLGWTQSNAPSISVSSFLLVSSILAKIITASDISAPPLFHEEPTAGNAADYGMWVAYRVVGAPVNLSIPSHNRTSGGSSAPGNVSINSSSLSSDEIAITAAMATGTDNTIQLSGITLDTEISRLDIGGYSTFNMDVRIGVKLDVGGANYTLSKGGDGQGNTLHGGYLRVSQ